MLHDVESASFLWPGSHYSPRYLGGVSKRNILKKQSQTVEIRWVVPGRLIGSVKKFIGEPFEQLVKRCSRGICPGVHRQSA